MTSLLAPCATIYSLSVSRSSSTSKRVSSVAIFHNTSNSNLWYKGGRPHVTPKATSSEQEIENLNKNYCDDFVCTSSPAVEMTVRALARDIIRANATWTRSLFSNQKLEYKGFCRFNGKDGYKSLNFIPKYLENPQVIVTKLRMIDSGCAEIQWRVQATIRGMPVDVEMTTRITMNLLTGQIEQHVDTWDLKRCSVPGALSFRLAQFAFAVSVGSNAAVDATASVLDSLTSIDENDGPFVQPNPNDPMKFFQQKDTFKEDAAFLIGAVMLLYFMSQAWTQLFTQ